MATLVEALEKERISNSIVGAIDRLDEAFERVDRVEKQLTLGQTSASHKYEEAVPPAVKEFDDFTLSNIIPLLEIAQHIDSKLESQINVLHLLISAVRALVLLSFKHKKPTDKEFETLCKPIDDLVLDIVNAGERLPKGSKLSDYYFLLAKGAQALNWVQVQNPVSHIQQQKIASEQTLIKLSKEGKPRSDPVLFSEFFGSFLKRLELNVQKYFSNGLSWKLPPLSSGSSSSSSSSSSSTASSAKEKEVPSSLYVRNIPYFGLPTIGFSRPSNYKSQSQLVQAPSEQVWICQNVNNTTSDIKLDEEVKQKGSKVSLNITYCSNSTFNFVNSNVQINSLILDSSSGVKVRLNEIDSSGSVTISNCYKTTLIIAKCGPTLPSINIVSSHCCTLVIPKSFLASNDESTITVSSSSNVNVHYLKEDNNIEETTVELPTQLKTTIKHGKLHTIVVI
eukprot:TRINITY_DN1403_c0_g1_i2.p1 TRINITY_DN1403_c0_g1~~TRINITY_DN1403_c0_g1_i2.p1  ORF type:complete len:465 (-),score=108.54 TRINITY_DN1403_c0_g1_i2:54-1406(-)